MKTTVPNKPGRFWAIGACLAVLISTMAGRFLFYLIGIITDVVNQFGQGLVPIATIWFWALLLPLSYMLIEIIWRISGFCGMRWIPGAEAEAYRSLYVYLTGHSAAYFSDRFAGALTNKIANASKGIGQLIANSLWQFFPMVIGVCADIFLVSLFHWYFSAIIASWCTVYLISNIFFVSRLYKRSVVFAESASTLRGKIVDSASNIETVQYSGELQYEQGYIGEYVKRQQQANLREWWFSEWVLVTNGLLLTVFMISMISTGVHLIEVGEISVGSLVTVITVVIALERSFFFLGQTLCQAVSFVGQVGEGLKELLEPHAVTTSENAPLLKITKGEISFNRVSFSYKDQAVFSDFSLTLKGGQKVGIVGHSGAGKSTLINLILRNFDVREGAICIDGASIKDVEISSLRKAIAVVPQTTSLFHRSIKDNIRYGRLEATDEEIIEAAKLSQAHEFISKMTNGYETFVGERGVKLSGGQRQRIAVARAILKRAPILILDEATSSLDSESEVAIQRALGTLMQGKTVIAIAHRLSTLRAMDRIIVLEHGKVVEDGSHDELIQRKGLYARLWENQVSGFIQE